jgi:hypothetical protein
MGETTSMNPSTANFDGVKVARILAELGQDVRVEPDENVTEDFYSQTRGYSGIRPDSQIEDSLSDVTARSVKAHIEYGKSLVLWGTDSINRTENTEAVEHYLKLRLVHTTADVTVDPFANALNDIRRLVQIPFAHELAQRLKNLRSWSLEDDGKDIDHESLRSFVAFLQVEAIRKRPDLTLTPERRVFAQWNPQKGRLFSLEFYGGNFVRFVILDKDTTNRDSPIRMSGRIEVGSVRRIAKANDANTLL